ncbi:hypothetical protein G8V03_09560 [Clostridium botulinum D/C]|uniref:hypothetical protein n=1 Tax=Clostridium botulinum TaxID=1491 RepID=UPI001E2C35F7|nr:hypothetical protein [Clostridium botulinum]MCD3351234.1 hypothetical protein [Clostridium botulinum D/C]MCD3360191.1 hypothetical protein [Clostridium botulinum D/C]MCD3361706.1 hypothetical protein [Clostridium botulinum D/C]MCD3365996.1 hypothetical protein [Clostridium botulinum D/C]
MERYKLVVENPLDAFILDTKENMIVTLCNTKRPDLEFDTLKELIDGKYLYCTHDCDFYNEDIGEWVFESEMYREMI